MPPLSMNGGSAPVQSTSAIYAKPKLGMSKKFVGWLRSPFGKFSMGIGRIFPKQVVCNEQMVPSRYPANNYLLGPVAPLKSNLLILF